MEEAIHPHSVPLEQIRVIEPEDARTFTVQALVMRLGATELYDYSDAELINSAPVPVTGQDGHQIGWASLNATERGVIATAHIDYHCPERFSIETGRVWPHAQIERFTREPVKGKPTEVDAYEITSIQLVPDIKAGDLPHVGRPIL